MIRKKIQKIESNTLNCKELQVWMYINNVLTNVAASSYDASNSVLATRIHDDSLDPSSIINGTISNDEDQKLSSNNEQLLIHSSGTKMIGHYFELLNQYYNIDDLASIVYDWNHDYVRYNTQMTLNQSNRKKLWY